MGAKLVKKTPAKPAEPEVSHNLLGQRLGRKGQETRERILMTALRLIESSQDTPLTLSAVAREASVGMTTLYLYFPDLGDLILAVLTRVMDSAGAAFEDQLRTRWPDTSLVSCAAEFLCAHHQFWVAHARLLQMRNNYADAGDPRFVNYRTRVSRPLADAFIMQMDGAPGVVPPTHSSLVATVLLITLERLSTSVTNSTFHWVLRQEGVLDMQTYIRQLLNVEAEVMALSIRQEREANRKRYGEARSA